VKVARSALESGSQLEYRRLGCGLWSRFWSSSEIYRPKIVRTQLNRIAIGCEPGGQVVLTEVVWCGV
jgi:hypothetical protein